MTRSFQKLHISGSPSQQRQKPRQQSKRQQQQSMKRKQKQKLEQRQRSRKRMEQQQIQEIVPARYRAGSPEKYTKKVGQQQRSKGQKKILQQQFPLGQKQMDMQQQYYHPLPLQQQQYHHPLPFQHKQDIEQYLRQFKADEQLSTFYKTHALLADWAIFKYLKKQLQNSCVIHKYDPMKRKNYEAKSILFDNDRGTLSVDHILWDQLKQCIHKNKRFGITVMGIHGEKDGRRWGHANAIIFDLKEKSLTRFEPHGYDIIDLYNYGLLDERIEKQIIDSKNNKNDDGYKIIDSYNPPSLFCPKLGPQTIEQQEGWKLQKYTGSGFCVTWSLLFIIVKLNYPYKTDEEVSDYLLNYGMLPKMIRQFIKFLESEIKPISQAKMKQVKQRKKRTKRKSGMHKQMLSGLTAKEWTLDIDKWVDDLFVDPNKEYHFSPLHEILHTAPCKQGSNEKLLVTLHRYGNEVLSKKDYVNKYKMTVEVYKGYFIGYANPEEYRKSTKWVYCKDKKGQGLISIR